MKNIWLILHVIGLLSPYALSQPVFDTKQTIVGKQIYRDLVDSSLYYYPPNELTLARDDAGKPKFQLTQMRYTGSACYADQGEKRFLNLLQFSVSMKPTQQEDLAQINRTLSARGPIRLKPLVIRSIEAYVVSPIGENPDQPQHIGGLSSLEQGGGSPSSQGAYWTERTFTLRLENYEAELLWKQVEAGKILLSFGYSFFADVITTSYMGEIQISGDSAWVEELSDQLSGVSELALDSIPTPKPVFSQTLPISIDIHRYPSCLNKLDINEDYPPAYPAIQLACYDFSEGYRQDLALKKVDFEAIGVNGIPLRPVSFRFSAANSDQNIRSVFFPFAVRMDREIRYRITEYLSDGEKKEGAWISREACEGLLDISTPANLLPFHQREIDIEVNWSEVDSLLASSLNFTIIYQYSGKTLEEKVQFNREDPQTLKVINLVFDKESAPVYYWEWVSDNIPLSAKLPVEKVTDTYYHYP